MRSLLYSNYQSGHSGLSNAIMSIEDGVVLAFLTNRFLLLDGNVSPTANIVSYDDRIDNSRPSRVTDLIDLPVAWAEPESIELDQVDSRELTTASLAELVFYYPSTLDVNSVDARAFAGHRKRWVSPNGELDGVQMLRLTEEGAGERGERRHNLSFYSYLFYLDDETRRAVYQLLTHMQPLPPFAALAKRVAEDLGRFNAVHMRRGDFKVTYGVTTLDRQPAEAIEALDHHFSREDLLVIVTDERDDPFFDEIKAAFPRHVFIDHHILDEYPKEFSELPQNDSIALAYLSQLVAAESQDFIGTMTSTFTSIIQRYRGNRGRQEPFKFLWNELPDPGQELERGRHPVSECIPLERGIMLEERTGPYSWNRCSSLVNPAWMREWPESFLREETLATGELPGRGVDLVTSTLRGTGDPERVPIAFEGLQVVLHTHDPRVAETLRTDFGALLADDMANVVADLEIETSGSRHFFKLNGKSGEDVPDDQLVTGIKRQLVPVFNHARRYHVWLQGVAVRRDERAFVIAGDFRPEMFVGSGWELLVDDVVPIRVKDNLVLPFGSTTGPTPLEGLIVATQRVKTRTWIGPLGPAVAVAQLITASLDFHCDRNRAIERLCRLVEGQPVAQLSFSDAESAVAAIQQQMSLWEDERRP